MARSIFFGLTTITLCAQIYVEASGGVTSYEVISNPFGNINSETTLNGDEFDITNKYIKRHNPIYEILFGKWAGHKNTGSVTSSKCCLNDNCLALKNGETCDQSLFPDSLKTGGFTITSYKETRSWTNTQSGDEPTVTDNTEQTGPTEAGDVEWVKPTEAGDAERVEPTEAGDAEEIYSNNLPNRKINENSKDDQLKKIRENVLIKTNYYRKKLGIKPLVLDDKMNIFAQKWADHLKGNDLSHRPDNAYGENLYATTDANNVGEKAVSAWYDEIKYYDPNDDENQLFARSGIHHMTQLLWKSSKKMGVGVSKDENGWYTVVANYDPRGNVGGYFKENLPQTWFN